MHKKIAYITETSPSDKHAWSGTAHYVYEALKKQGYEVSGLGPLQPTFIGFCCKVINQLSLKLFKKRFDYRHSKIYSKAFGRLFSEKLKTINYDYVVVCGGTEYAAYLKTTKPIFLILDRTIEGTLNYHPVLTDLWNFSRKASIETDKKAMLLATKTFFSSQWAAHHATTFYYLPDKKVCVLPFGANLDKIPTRETALKIKDTSVWKLLLIGTYWKNKGADIAFNTLINLLENNINAQLTVVGCTPPDNLKHERLTIIPFVDKNTPDGIKVLWELFLSHHFFILPTRFDCTPIVFCEASAFGLPIISSDTGGVRSHVIEGENGYLIPLEDNGNAYADKIMEIIKSNTYQDLCITTRNCYEKNLNWESWANNFTEEIEIAI